MPFLAACGGDGKHASEATAEKPAAVAPTYRTGQYCFEKREHAYRSRGFTCRGNHLRKRG